jgi:HAD superfamily hydrolase (TIGR01490 family)
MHSRSICREELFMGSELNATDSSMRAAFFDVDDTLLSEKSMFVFLRYWIKQRDGDDSAYQKIESEIRAKVESGVHRTKINRMYYRLFAGVPLAELLAAGRDWYRTYREMPTAFVGATLSAVATHQVCGDIIVLISGSFQACLEPLATEIFANRVVCTEPIVDNKGRLTGEVVRPMIGENKAAGVAETMASLGLLPEDCFCYGGHSSDLQMLLQVGHPRVVGKDPVLLEHARRNGWPVLPANPSPLDMTVNLRSSKYPSQ